MKSVNCMIKKRLTIILIFVMTITTQACGNRDSRPIAVSSIDGNGYLSLRIESNGRYFATLELFTIDESIALSANDGRKYRLDVADLLHVLVDKDRSLVIQDSEGEEFICIMPRDIWDDILRATCNWSSNAKGKFVEIK